MVALLVGLALIIFAVYSVLSVEWSLGWWNEVIEFLKGGVPVFAVLIGVISFFVGIADIRDKIEAKREQADEKSEIDQLSVGNEKEGSNVPPDDSG